MPILACVICACSRRRESVPAPPPSASLVGSVAPRAQGADWLQSCDPNLTAEVFCPSGTDLKSEHVGKKYEMWCVRRSDGAKHGGFIRCDEHLKPEVLSAYRNGVRTNGTCGSETCPPHAVCALEGGVARCKLGAQDAGADAGVPHCGGIFCAAPCKCVDPKESVCSCG